MAGGIALSTIGAKLSWQKITIKADGTYDIPTYGFKHIQDISSIPEIDSEPDTIETTTLDNLVFRTYIDGLKDMGGTIAITANFTNKFFTDWQAMYDEYMSSGVNDDILWAIDIPDFDNVAFFTANPSPLGVPALDTNALIEKDAYITPTREAKWVEIVGDARKNLYSPTAPV